jgi:hypothetical protein
MNKNYIIKKQVQKSNTALKAPTLSGSRLKKTLLVLFAFFVAINLQAQVYGSAVGGGSLSLSKNNTSVVLAFASSVPANTIVYVNVDDASNLSFDVGTTSTGTNGTIASTTTLNGPNNTTVIAITSANSFQYIKISISGNNTATVNSAFYTTLNIADCGTPIATSPDYSVTFFGVGRYNNNTSYAIDNDLTTASNFSLTVAATGTLTQTIFLNGPSNLGDGVSILYQIPGSIDVSLFGGVTFQAYNGSTPVGDAQSLASLVSILGIGRSTNKTRLTFYPNTTTTQTFDNIKISFDFGVSVGFGAQALIYDVERVPAIPLLSNASYSACSPVVGNAVAAPAQNINGVGPLAYTWYKADGTAVTNGTTNTADNISTIPLATLLGTTTPAAGMYTFTVKVHKAGCLSANTDPSSIQTVIIKSVNTSTPKLLSSGTLGATLNLVTTCADANGYIPFVDPNNVNNKYIAINPNGNTGYNFKSGIAINNLVSPTSIIGNAASAISTRLFSVIDGGTPPYTAGGGMKVRIYFTPADTTATRGLVNTVLGAVHGGGILSNGWFKVPGLASTLSSLLTPTGITGALNLTSKATYGTEGTGNAAVQYVEFSGIQSFSTFGFVAANGNQSILPITGFNLSGVLNNGVPQLSWTTITEVNSNYFNIESSTDGVTFNTIGNLAAAGNSNTTKSYVYADKLATSSVVYYRIKEVDKDGSASYSNIIAVSLSGMNRALKVYPNPVTNLVNVETGTPGSYVAELFTVDGKKVTSTQIATASGLVTVNIDRTNIPSGIYLLKLTGKSGSTITYNTIMIK